MLPTHSQRPLCTHTFLCLWFCLFMCRHIWLWCVYTCMTELAAKTKRVGQRKDENVCMAEFAMTLPRCLISITVEGQHAVVQKIQHVRRSTGTLLLLPTVCQGHIYKTHTPTHKLYMHTGRETNSLPVMHCNTPGSGLMDWKRDLNRFKVQF